MNMDARHRVRVVNAEAGMPPAAQAARLRAEGAAGVLVHGTRELHWLDTAHASGWVRAAAPQDAAQLATDWDALCAQGYVAADAALLAFGALPLLSWGDVPPEAVTSNASASDTSLGIYAIVDSAHQVRQVLEAGVRTVQLRMKRPADADARWHAALADAVRESVAAVRGHGALLFVNDHWRVAAELGATAVHLGQEDLLALGEAGRAELRATGLALGISSHAVWELCRARALAPAYIACGPVWPTTTKDMPWRPQGLDNLAWWTREAGCPVVAIGGILEAEKVVATARAGASGVCVLRGLGADPKQVVPSLQQAFLRGRSERGSAPPAPARPHPTLEPTA
jgi:thiamine-phosphate diphosphorylase